MLSLPRSPPSKKTMTNQKDIAKKQAEIVGQLQQFPIGRTNSGGRAGGMVEVVVTNPLPGQPRVVQAKCANDCPPGEVQLLRADDESYVALSRLAAQKTSETTTRQVSRKNPTIPKKDKEFWPVTSCFLYTRIKGMTEKLTGNGAAQGIEETSWSAMRAYSSPNTSSFAYGFAERLDDLGNYKSAEDAMNNVLRPECLIVPTGEGSTGAARDNAVGDSGSADSVIVWFYIGELQNDSGATLANAGDGQIFEVLGVSGYGGSVNTEQGPGFCMEMYRQGSISVSLYPITNIGTEPLTKHLSKSFPDLGGRIGYWGSIYKWHGMDDYTTGGNRTTFLYRYYWDSGGASGGIPAVRNETFQSPTSVPPDWQPGVSNYSPWTLEDAPWYRFGWDNQRIACMSGGVIVAVTSAITGSFNCGDTIPGDKWYWGGGIGPSAGALDKRANYSIANGMFVCWQGHKDHIGLAQSFFEAFRTYWDIPGTVTKLRSCNLYGCEIPGGGGGYPPAPPSDARRFLVEAYGRKAKVLLVCHKQDYEPIELELPFEYAAVVEEMKVLGGGSFGTGSAFEAGKSVKTIRTYGAYSFGPFSLDLIHGTLSIDNEFAYVDIFYGGERLYEEPKTFPLIIELAAQGFGSPTSGPGSNYGNDKFGGSGSGGQRLGLSPQESYGNMYPSGWPQTPVQTGEKYPRFLKDCWSRCQSIKIRLPTKDDRTLTIVGSQKYKKGETITLTVNNPDNEFNKKFLIRDYRTDSVNFPLKTPNSEYASFGGLPALIQQQFISSAPGFTINDIPLPGLFYKNKQDWTKMDWIHYQLQEMPRQYNPLITVLPFGVSIERDGIIKVNVINDLDKKFGRHGRAEKIMTASSFGYLGTFNGGNSPFYISQGQIGTEFLFISHKEQLIGNGLIENAILTKWYRVTTSSFPIHGQLLRNTN